MSQAKGYQIETDSAQADEDIFFYNVSDDVIERTAEAWSTGAFTIGNCTGLGSCPA